MPVLLVAAAIIAAPTGASASRIGSRAKLYFKDAFLQNLWTGTKATFTEPQSLMTLLTGGALAAAAHQYDWEVDDYWEDHRMPYGLADIGNEWGNTYPTAVISASLMLAGWSFEREDLAGAGEALMEAGLISGALVNIVKPLAGKERPNGGDKAFPSGHTNAAFVTAAVLQDRFGWGIGIPAYTLAIITGLARMDVEAHWVSDVVMGAAIGIAAGYAVSRTRDEFPYGSLVAKPLVTPICGRDRLGLGLAFTF